jgi:hypothetical protein
VLYTNSSGSSVDIAALNFDLIVDETIFDPTAVTNGSTFTGGTWNCGLATSPDVDPSPTVAKSRLACFIALDVDARTVANGASVTLGTVSYSVLGGGTSAFTLSDVSVNTLLGAELMSCNPVIDVAGACADASITVAGAAVPTSTPTNTPTATPTQCVGAACPTATSVAFRTVTPTPGPETPTAVPTSPPGTEPTQPGGQIPPGGGGPGGQPGGGGAGPIRLPDTGTEGAGESSPWTWVIVAAATAVAAGGAAGGVYYRRLQAQRGQAQGEE